MLVLNIAASLIAFQGFFTFLGKYYVTFNYMVSYWERHSIMSSPVSVGGWLVCRSVCHDFKFHFPCLFIECADIFLVVFIFPLAKCRTMVYRCQTKDLKTSLKTKKADGGEIFTVCMLLFFCHRCVEYPFSFFDHIFFL